MENLVEEYEKEPVEDNEGEQNTLECNTPMNKPVVAIL